MNWNMELEKEICKGTPLLLTQNSLPFPDGAGF